MGIIELFLKLIKGIFLLIVLFLFSCSGEPPQVLDVWWQLNLIDDIESEDHVESLSLFVNATDEDGHEDIDQIYLINDDEQMYWNIPADKWDTYIEQSVTWIGLNELRAPGDGIFPEGNYRVLLIDLGGERTEFSFFLRNSIPYDEEVRTPEISFTIDNVTINSQFPKFQLWFYDVDGKLIDKSKDFLMGSYQWNDIVRNISRRASSFLVYTEPETGSWGLISGPYYFN